MRLQGLRAGDIVDIVAPASRCSPQDLRQGLEAVRQAGFLPRVPRDLFGGPSTSLFANSDEQRLRQLRKALYAPDSKLIWCVRGGYGALRLLPAMAKWRQPNQAKIVLGYSDITTLHGFLNQHWGWPTLHGPLLDRFGRDSTPVAEKRELLALLRGEVLQAEFKGLKAMNAAARRPHRLGAPLVGGNMAVLQSGLGTPWTLAPKGQFLFFEDTGERPHRVDRMLTQMAQAGWFARARAVLFGNFLLNEANDRRQLWNDVIRRFAESQKIPVLSGLQVGHDPRRQRTLPLATKAELHLGAAPRLRVASGIVRPSAT